MVGRRGLLSVVAGAMLACHAGSALAGDYRPVVCEGAKSYIGGPVHPPIVVEPPTSGAETGFDPLSASRLDAAFAKAVAATSAPAMTAAVFSPGRGFWSASTASADRPLLFWASAGKTLTAIVILQLVEEERLSLSDPVSKWIKAVPNGDVITVRDLLAHTSGLFSANEDLKARAAHRGHSLAEDLTILRRHGAMFCPGERWRYSNTGYALLGAIIEKVDGRVYPDAITERVIKPLGLERLRALRGGETEAHTSPLVSTKAAPIEPAWAGAAGPVVGTADDMVRVWSALLAGRLLKPQTVQAMFAKPYPMFDPGAFYGLGVMVFQVPQPDGGHDL